MDKIATSLELARAICDNFTAAFNVRDMTGYEKAVEVFAEGLEQWYEQRIHAEARESERKPLAASGGEEGRPALGVCSACHAVLDSNQIERMGESWGHVVASMGSHGEPEPNPCGPVEVYYRQPAPTQSPDAGDRVGATVCPACDGSGKDTDADNDVIECEYCKGTGEIRAPAADEAGWNRTETIDLQDGKTTPHRAADEAAQGEEPCAQCSIIKGTACGYCGPPAWEGYSPLNKTMPAPNSEQPGEAIEQAEIAKALAFDGKAIADWRGARDTLAAALRSREPQGDALEALKLCINELRAYRSQVGLKIVWHEGAAYDRALKAAEAALRKHQGEGAK